jgi:hypothetical protein
MFAAAAIRELGLQDAGGARAHEDAHSLRPHVARGAPDRVEEPVLREAQLGGAVVAAIEARQLARQGLPVHAFDLTHERVELHGLEAAGGEAGGAGTQRRPRRGEAMAKAGRHRVGGEADRLHRASS